MLAVSARRRIVWVVLGAACAMSALLIWIVASPSTQHLPAGDVAVIESYTLQATKAGALLGPYSRFSWNHPGPLYFYALAPLYAASGQRTTAIFVGAAVLNVIALALAIAVCRFAARGTFAIALAAGIAFYAVRAAETIASAWNPHVLPPAFIGFIVLAAAAMSGRSWLWPLIAVDAAFLTQTHLGTAPTVAITATVALAGACIASTDRRQLARWLIGAGLLFIALWIPPIVEEWRYHPGNLSRIRDFLEPQGRAHAWPAAVALWSDLLSGLFRPGFVIPWGGLMPVDRTGRTELIAYVQIALVALGTLTAARERQVFQRSMGILLIVASSVSLWSVTRLTGDLFHYAIFWVTALGVLNAAFILDMLLDALGIRISGRGHRLITAACLACAAIALFPVWRETSTLLANPEQRLTDGLKTRQLAGDLEGYMRAHPSLGRPLIRMDVESWPIGAGIIVHLEKAGFAFAVERGWVTMFSEAVGPDGRESWTVTIAAGKRRDAIRAEGRLQSIGERDGVSLFVDPTRPAFEPRQ